MYNGVKAMIEAEKALKKTIDDEAARVAAEAQALKEQADAETKTVEEAKEAE
jgi:hypothetical protein